MTCRYLTLEDRRSLEQLYSQGAGLSDIANSLKVHIATIYRELASLDKIRQRKVSIKNLICRAVAIFAVPCVTPGCVLLTRPTRTTRELSTRTAA